MSIIIAILIFGIIITVHEFGHFIVAKLNKVRVNEFSIGMGPAIFKKTKGDTLYSLRIFPIGGYCSMDEDKTSDSGDAFCNKSVLRRFSILFAGAGMNIILGLVVSVIFISMSSSISSTVIQDFRENGTSSETGLQKGDEILKINGMRTLVDSDIIYQLTMDKDKIFSVQVKRNGEKIDLKDVKISTIQYVTQDGQKFNKVDFVVRPEAKNIGTVLEYSFKKAYSVGRLVWISLGDLVSGNFDKDDLSGPVGIVSVIGQAVDSSVDYRAAIQNVLFLTLLMTINVGIFNLLPLPALDGGRIVFLIIEAIRGKPIKPEHEGIVHFVGLALLMVLMLFVTFNDIARLTK